MRYLLMLLVAVALAPWASIAATPHRHGPPIAATPMVITDMLPLTSDSAFNGVSAANTDVLTHDYITTIASDGAPTMPAKSERWDIRLTGIRPVTPSTIRQSDDIFGGNKFRQR